jgi:hypothetical protein
MYFNARLKRNARNIEIDEDNLWAKAEKLDPNIKNGKGCYVFGISKGGGAPKPWYVGKTKKKFGIELFSHRNSGNYNSWLGEENRGKPVIILIVYETPHGKTSTRTDDRLMQWVEDYLIGIALLRNPDLKNVLKTAKPRNIFIPSILNAKRGPTTPDSRKLKSMLFGGQKRNLQNKSPKNGKKVLSRRGVFVESVNSFL